MMVKCEAGSMTFHFPGLYVFFSCFDGFNIFFAVGPQNFVHSCIFISYFTYLILFGGKSGALAPRQVVHTTLRTTKAKCPR